MTITKHRSAGARGLVASLVVSALALGLGGCSDGVELNGKIFDAMGISAAAQAKSNTEPKMPSRAGLVLPPDPSRLPAPGSGETADTALAAVADPDVKKAANAAERARLHKAYCSGEMNWKERVADPSARPTSPYGPCGMLGDALKQE